MKKPSPLVPDLMVIVWTITASYITGTVAPIKKQKIETKAMASAPRSRSVQEKQSFVHKP